MTWFSLALLSAICAAFVTIFAKMGVQRLDSTLATTIRTVIMAFLLLVITATLKKYDGFSLSQLGGKEMFFIFLSGIAGALSLLFYFASLKAGDAGKVAVIDRLSLIFIVILSAFLFKEKFDIRSIIGVIMVVLGAILVSWK